jgi:threonyl-tRNA synthetase
MADFGVLHRNEASGALHGMTRVRKFQQDDAHVFCTTDQIKQEIEGLFDFLSTVYSLFGFTFKLLLSTRPEKYMGELEVWNKAEATLKEALDGFAAQNSTQWELNEGDGAFYGPKIDIEIQDALKRSYQCATIQLDFQLPRNFELEYMTGENLPKQDKEAKETTKETKESKQENKPAAEPTKGEEAAPEAKKQPREPKPGYARPVMLHRAIVGSFERFFAIITEHFAGKWPFWLSPRQVMIVPVMPSANDYVVEVQQLLRAEGMHADVDISGNTMPKKILRAQQAQYNFIFGKSSHFVSDGLSQANNEQCLVARRKKPGR